MKLFEEKLKSEKVFEGKIFDVSIDQIKIHQNNEETIREVVHHSGGVCVAAQTKNNTFLMVKQYRYAQEEVGLEFIAGKLEHGEDPNEAIKRELHEEGGVIASTWIKLGETFPSPAYLKEKIHLYYASDLTEVGQDLDENEFVEVTENSLDELIKMIEANEVKDLKTIALAYRLQVELSKPAHQTIQTDRLVLVPINQSYTQDLFNSFTPDIITYLFPTLHESVDFTKIVVNSMIQGRFNGDELVYAITKDNEFLGVCGLHSLKEDSQELGIWLKKEAHGHKYGLEAITALVGLAKQLKLMKLIYPVDHRNISSTKIPESLGFTTDHQISPLVTADNRELEIVNYELQLD